MYTESGARAPRITHRMPLPRWIAAVAWAMLSFGGFVAAIYALVWPVAQLEQVTGLPHPVPLGIWAFGWAVGSGLLALVAGRLVFGEWLEVRPPAWPILLCGAVVSAATVSILADWTIAKFGMNESDLVGPMSLLFGVIAGVAVAGFGVQVAPRWAVWSPLLAVAGAALVALAVVASNIPGLADGLGADSGPLAAVTLAAVVYVGAVVLVSLARVRPT